MGDERTLSELFHADHLADLRKSGLSDETIEQSGVYSVPPADISKKLGYSSSKIESLLAIPYDKDFERYKVFPPLEDKDGHKIKYLQPKNSGVHLYVPANLNGALNDCAKQLYFVEGEKKALSGAQEGLCIVGLGGMWNWKEKDQDCPISTIKNLSLVNRQVILIPDSDFNRNDLILLAVYRLAQELEKLGAYVNVVCLLPDAGEKVGLDDFLVKHSLEEFQSLQTINLKHSIFKANKIKRKEKKGDALQNTKHTAYFDGFVEIVELDGSLAFLFHDEDDFRVVNSIERDGEILIPPPKETMSWLLPRGDKVLSYLEIARSSKDSYPFASLYNELLEYHRKASDLPLDEFYDLLVNYDFLSHICLDDQIRYLPMIVLFSVAERGKTRTAKAMIYVEPRGVHITSLREAHILRLTNNLNTTIFFDEMDLWKKAENNQSEDVLLQRFEKGAMVPRVTKPEAGPHLDTGYYSVFGPTTIGTNRSVHHILGTRALQICMRDSDKQYENPVVPEDSLALKERLTAFHAWFIGKKLPDIYKPAKGRLGDILKPIVQMVGLINPDRLKQITKVVEHFEDEKSVAMTETYEAKIVYALLDLEGDVEGRKEDTNGSVKYGKLLISKIEEEVNKDKVQDKKISSATIGKVLKSLGFKTRRAGAKGATAVVWDDDLIASLKTQYNPDESENLQDHSDLSVEPKNLLKGRDRFHPSVLPSVENSSSKQAKTEGSELTEGNRGREEKKCASTTDEASGAKNITSSLPLPSVAFSPSVNAVLDPNLSSNPGEKPTEGTTEGRKTPFSNKTPQDDDKFDNLVIPTMNANESQERQPGDEWIADTKDIPSYE